MFIRIDSATCNPMTAVAFSDILGFGLGFGGYGLVNITAGLIWSNSERMVRLNEKRKQSVDVY